MYVLVCSSVRGVCWRSTAPSWIFVCTIRQFIHSKLFPQHTSGLRPSTPNTYASNVYMCRWHSTPKEKYSYDNELYLPGQNNKYCTNKNLIKQAVNMCGTYKQMCIVKWCEMNRLVVMVTILYVTWYKKKGLHTYRYVTCVFFLVFPRCDTEGFQIFGGIRYLLLHNLSVLFYLEFEDSCCHQNVTTSLAFDIQKIVHHKIFL
jgi:hypothetical protein